MGGDNPRSRGRIGQENGGSPVREWFPTQIFGYAD